MANVFVSHRGTDAKEAERLSNELVKAGHKVWLDSWKIDVGDSIVQRINEGLEGSTYLVLCYSSSGVLSPWMGREWMSFLAGQLNGKDVKLLPAMLTSGEPPAILDDIKYADLVKDWDKGVSDLLRAIK
jgi:hypothetical protein